MNTAVAVYSERTRCPELHFLSLNDANFLVHPGSASILRVSRLTTEVLAACASGLSPEEASAKYHVGLDEVATLLHEVRETVGAEEKRKSFFDPNAPMPMRKLALLVSNACNLQCTYCYAQEGTYTRGETLMSEAIATKAVQKIGNWGDLETVVFLGREPSLNCAAIEAACKQVESMVKERRIKKPPNMGMITNGTFITDDLIELVNRFNLHITVSLDGPPEVNDLNRKFKDGRGTFAVIEENVYQLREKTHGREPSEFEVVYTKRHAEYGVTSPMLMRFFEDKFGVIPTIRLVSPPNDVCLDLMPTDDEVVSNFDALAAYVIDSWTSERPLALPVEFGSQEALFGGANLLAPLCGAGLSMLAVDTGGNIYPCHTLTREEFKMGNIADPEVFNSAAFTRVQDVFLGNSKLNNPSCSACWIRAFCCGCYYQVFNQTGAVTKMPEAMCEVKRRIAERLILRLGQLRTDPARWRLVVGNLHKAKPSQTCL